MIKLFIAFITVFTLNSCAGESNNKAMIENNKFLIGIWHGEGRMLNRTLDAELGRLPIRIEVTENGITGAIGEAKLKNPELTTANYGLCIQAELDNPVDAQVDFDKDRFVLLLVLPDTSVDTDSIPEANFHLKSNFFFDFTMAVGGVSLKKAS